MTIDTQAGLGGDGENRRYHRRSAIKRALQALVAGALVGSDANANLVGAGAPAAPRVRRPTPRRPGRTVSITDYPGADPSGKADSTRALQAALDALPGGGTVLIPAGAFRIARVDVRHRDITVRLAAGATLRKHGMGGLEARGLFWLENLPDAGFVLDGEGTIDLNGEGPRGIGVAGRIPNVYAPQLTPRIDAISGPGNAAVYALRCTGITVRGVTICNSGESGLLFRNCSDTLVENAKFRNLANFGVEYNFVVPQFDGGTAPMPDRGRGAVRGCSFEDIDDYAMGTGNGVGVGGGGASGLGALRDYVVEDCSFVRCGRDIHMEFPHKGTWIDGFAISGIRSTDAGIGSIGLIGARNGRIDKVRIDNPGGPAAGYICRYMTGDYPDIYGIYLSGDFSGIVIGDDVRVTDTRSGGIVQAGDGAAAAGRATFTSALGRWSTADIGKPIAIARAGPNGLVHVTTIAAVNGPRSIELAQAPRTSLNRTTYAYGGCTRQGIVAWAGASIDIGRVTVVAGAASGLPSEPEASAMRIQYITGTARIGACTLTAPKNGTSRPCGLRMAHFLDGLRGELRLNPGMKIAGFLAPRVGG